MPNNQQFIADIDAFIFDSIEDMKAVMLESVQGVIELAQTPRGKGGRMPVLTGNLRNSIVFIDGSGKVFANPENRDGRLDGGAYVLGIAQANAFEKMSFGWTAPYAEFVEFGTSRQQAAGFASMAVENWETIVYNNARRLTNG